MQAITFNPNKPGQRFSDAIAIDAGACNPIAISRALVRAIEEIRDQDTDAICNDPAVRLIVHQLAHLTSNFYLFSDATEYDKAVVACKSGATRYVVGGTVGFPDMESALARASQIFNETGVVVSVVDKEADNA